MPRFPRNYIKTTAFHVITQGINRSYIFENPEDIKYYIKVMYKLNEQCKIKIVAYCIMNNHAHILIETDKVNDLSKYMQRLNTIYAKYYNKKYSRVGYVFRDRYKSEGIYSEEHLYNCIKYIYDNPVKAGISTKEEAYRFSSYKNYISKSGNVNNKLLEIVFNNKKDYLKIMNLINYESLNLEKEDINLEEVLKKFLVQKNIKLEQIQKDSLLIKKFISYLISNEYEFKKKDVAKILNISRAQLYRKLN